MALKASPFPWELWLEICRLAESEYAEIDAKHARGIVTGLSGLSRSCRTFYNILQPSIYGSPVLVGVRSLELYFRTVVENDNLASMARMVRWYEGDRREVECLIGDELLFKIKVNGGEEDPFDFGDNFNAKYSAKVHSMQDINIEPPDFYGTRGTHKVMHQYPQLLPFFLPNLKALDYQHERRIRGFPVLSYDTLHPDNALPLTDISIRAAREDFFELSTLINLFSRSADTLVNLHLEWPLGLDDDGSWPPHCLFPKLRTLSIYDGCLGFYSFHELIDQAPRLEEFAYHSALVPYDDNCFGGEIPGREDDAFLSWSGIIYPLLRIRNTLQRLELGLHRRYFRDLSEFGIGLANFESLRTVVLGQDAILHDAGEPQAKQRLIEILPKNLKHLELRHIRCEYPQIEVFAEAVRNGEYPKLETVEMDIKCLDSSYEDCKDSLREIKAMMDSRGVRTKVNTFEEE